MMTHEVNGCWVCDECSFSDMLICTFYFNLKKYNIYDKKTAKVTANG